MTYLETLFAEYQFAGLDDKKTVESQKGAEQLRMENCLYVNTQNTS